MSRGLWKKIKVKGKIIEWLKAENGGYVNRVLKNVEIDSWKDARAYLIATMG